VSAIKTYYSCAELAAMKLPGFPETRQGWHKRAKEENWPYIESRGQGRGGVTRKYQVPQTILNRESATGTKEIRRLDVALGVHDYVLQHFGDCGTNPEVLEGMWLAMQMLGGPVEAARVIRCCAIEVGR
jgi:hypothetical protein